MSRQQPHKTTDVTDFVSLDNVNREYEIGLNGLAEANNVDITRAKKLRRRKGQTLVTADSYVGLWTDGHYAMALDATGTVYALDAAFGQGSSYTTLQATGPHFRLRGARVLDTIILSNGFSNLLVDGPSGTELQFDQTDFGDRTFDYSVPPAFIDIEIFAGRAYYAGLDRVYYSPVFGYFKVRLGKDYFRFPDQVTMVAQVSTGLFVGTLSKTYFISNRDPKQASLIEVADTGVIEGTKAYVEGDVVGEGQTKTLLPVWASSSGFAVGLPNGEVNKVTQKYVALPQGSIGSAMFRNQDGQNHIVSVIQT